MNHEGRNDLESRTRLELLERLSGEAGEIRKKIDEALEAVSRDGVASEQARMELEELRAANNGLSARNRKLEKKLAQQQLEFESATGRAMSLKLEIADLQMKLAKATALAQSSQAVVSGLEEAGETALTLTSQYRDETNRLKQEIAELRGAVELHEASSNDRDQLLENAMQTNEDLEVALRRERERNRALSQRLADVDNERKSQERSSLKGTGELQLSLKRAAAEAKVARDGKEALEKQMRAVLAEHRRTEETVKALRSELMQQRIDSGVREKLLEDNAQALTVYISELEQLLGRNGVAIPKYLSLAPQQHEVKTANTEAEPENIIDFRTAGRDAG